MRKKKADGTGTTDSARKTSASLKKYTKPKLTEYGDFRDIVKKTKGGSRNDGGAGVPDTKV